LTATDPPNFSSLGRIGMEIAISSLVRRSSARLSCLGGGSASSLSPRLRGVTRYRDLCLSVA
jgi:hypothetical protein